MTSGPTYAVSPAMVLNNVVFPAEFSPTMHTNSPFLIWMSMSFN